MRRVLVEVGLTYVAATAIMAPLYRVGALQDYYSAIIAAVLLYLPTLVLRDRTLGDFGLTLQPWRKSLALVAGTTAVVFPLFALGFVAWHRAACAVPALRALVVGPCVGASLHLRVPWEAWWYPLAEFMVVALPEEFFFRGYVQGRLAEVWKSRLLFGAPVGPVVVASALFALCHLVVQGAPPTLAVFFPGLVFGWMRARTGSLLPGALFHALCNLYIQVLQASLYG